MRTKMTVSEEIDETYNEMMDDNIMDGDIENIKIVTGLCRETCEMVIDGRASVLFTFDKMYLLIDGLVVH